MSRNAKSKTLDRVFHCTVLTKDEQTVNLTCWVEFKVQKPPKLLGCESLAKLPRLLHYSQCSRKVTEEATLALDRWARAATSSDVLGWAEVVVQPEDGALLRTCMDDDSRGLLKSRLAGRNMHIRYLYVLNAAAEGGAIPPRRLAKGRKGGVVPRQAEFEGDDGCVAHEQAVTAIGGDNEGPHLYAINAEATAHAVVVA